MLILLLLMQRKTEQLPKRLLLRQRLIPTFRTIKMIWRVSTKIYLPKRMTAQLVILSCRIISIRKLQNVLTKILLSIMLWLKRRQIELLLTKPQILRRQIRQTVRYFLQMTLLIYSLLSWMALRNRLTISQRYLNC